MSIEVDCSSFIDGIELVKKAYPKKVEKFMLNEGNKLKRRTLKNVKKKVKKKTGNYEESIKRGKHYIYGGKSSVRVYSDAPHAHLIEYGHVQQTRNGEKFVEGKHIIENSKKEFQPKYEQDTEKFFDGILDSLN